MQPEPALPASRGARVAVFGLGNIGSPLVPLLARNPRITEAVLGDPDVYEAKNLVGQAIERGDVGRPKVLAQARRLKQLRPDMEVHAYQAEIADVPPGLLRCHVMLSCVDSPAARRQANEAAWRLGAWLVDGAVDGDGLLGRVCVYRPGPDGPCLECAWSDETYAAADQTYPCLGGRRPEAPPTGAPAALGSLVASIMAVENDKILAGRLDESLAGRGVLVDMKHHVHELTRYIRNPLCRFDHATWAIEDIDAAPSRLTLAGLVERAGGGDRPGGPWRVALEGHAFARMLCCVQCGWHRPIGLRLARRLPPSRRRCELCGGGMIARGIDLVEQLEGPMLRGRTGRRSLSSFGIAAGDVVTVAGPDGETHYMLGRRAARDGPPSPARRRRAGREPAGVASRREEPRH
jgi:molybdopterin/thiamine biosynthesis adenylyltransferase